MSRMQSANLQQGMDQAEAARRRGDNVAALATLRGLLEESPDHPLPYLRAATVLMDLRQFDDAESLLSAGAERFPQDAGFVIDRAWVALRRGDLGEAATRWATVRKEVPN